MEKKITEKKKVATPKATKKPVAKATKKPTKVAPALKTLAEAAKDVVKKVDNKMTVLENPLITRKYTTILHDTNNKFNAPHTFNVVRTEPDADGEHKGQNRIVGIVHFQEGPIKEFGVNGIANEDALAMVLCRLEGFQASEFKCRENAIAITKIEEALMWLRKRTLGREIRNVEGTSKV